MSVLRRSVLVSAALLVAALLPAAAKAENFSFANLEGFGPSEEAGAFGPATHYPGTINLAGLNGTVKKVTVTAIGFRANFDLDMALVGPNGAQVMLMSDACSGGSPAQPQIWTFDDDAPEFVPAITCPAQRKTYRPANYEPEGIDDFGPGGPSGEFSTRLSSFNGISPNGAWKLFLIDDSPGLVGFEMTGFTLNLELEPPPPTQTNVPTPAPVQTPAKKKKKTGKRAAALAKCKTKKTKKARNKCRAKAKKLPV